MAEGPIHGGFSSQEEDDDHDHPLYTSLSQDEALSDLANPRIDTSSPSITKYQRYVYALSGLTVLTLFVAFVVDVSESKGPLRIVNPKESGRFPAAIVSLLFYGIGIVVAAVQVWQVRTRSEKYLRPIWLSSLAVSAFYLFSVVTSLLTIVIFDLMGKKKAKGSVIGGHMITVAFIAVAATAFSLSSHFFRLIIKSAHPDTVSLAPLDTFSSSA